MRSRRSPCSRQRPLVVHDRRNHPGGHRRPVHVMADWQPHTGRHRRTPRPRSGRRAGIDLRRRFAGPAPGDPHAAVALGGAAVVVAVVADQRRRPSVPRLVPTAGACRGACSPAARPSSPAPCALAIPSAATSAVESVTEKNGRSGKLVIVVTSTTLFAPDGTPAVVEKQNLVYREAAAPTGTPPPPSPPPRWSPAGPPIIADGERRWTLRTDPTLLMRFSAATANAHRIHYDWPYATGVEGYPGLVVHGPLMTLALLGDPPTRR